MTNEPHSVVLVDVHDGLATVTLNRPDLLNAMSAELLQALHDAMLKLAGDASVRALVLRGAGPSFSAGGDLSKMVDWDTRDAELIMRLSHAMRERVETFPRPTIAAVHGYAMGGGLELAICCDFIFLTASARVGLPEVKVGAIPSSGGCTRLPGLVGPLNAKRMILTGDSVSAEEALRIGLATAVVPDDGLEAACAALYARLRRGSPTALEQAKKIVNSSRGVDFATAQRYELEAALRNFESPHRVEGMRAFLEKRDAAWR